MAESSSGDNGGDLAGAEPALEVSVCSDVGTERPDNQDCGYGQLMGSTAALVVVADGVSGQAGGGVASKMAVDALVRTFQEQGGRPSLGRRLWRAAQQANIDIYDYAVVVSELRGMGTTLTALAIEHGQLVAAHVGDSRMYLVRHGTITQLTKDHTVTGDKVRLGLLSPARARRHPDRSVLTRCLGRELIVNLDQFTRRVEQGDTFLLCTDGLYNALEESEIAAIVRDRDATSACRELVAAANRLGTMDNLTAAMVRMIGPAASGAIKGGGNRGGVWGRLRGLMPGRGRS